MQVNSTRLGAMNPDHEVRNELEQKLLDAQDGRISSDELLETLMTSQVFMPIQDEKPAVLNVQRSSRAQPLVLNAEDGTPVLVLFSSPERAKGFTATIRDTVAACWLNSPGSWKRWVAILALPSIPARKSASTWNPRPSTSWWMRLPRAPNTEFRVQGPVSQRDRR
jgi:hypothetical protein